MATVSTLRLQGRPPWRAIPPAATPLGWHPAAAPVLNVEAAEVVAGLLGVVDVLKHDVCGAA